MPMSGEYSELRAVVYQHSPTEQKTKNAGREVRVGARWGCTLPLGGGHWSWGLFRIPSPAAVEADILKDHDACLQIHRRFGSQAALTSLTTLDVGCAL